MPCKPDAAMEMFAKNTLDKRTKRLCTNFVLKSHELKCDITAYSYFLSKKNENSTILKSFNGKIRQNIAKRDDKSVCYFRNQVAKNVFLE
jgi:hypothetical protein